MQVQVQQVQVQVRARGEETELFRRAEIKKPTLSVGSLFFYGFKHKGI